jgi:hypothetical protein
MYKSVDVDIDIEFDDIMEYITDHASSSEISKIRKIDAEESDNGLTGSYIREEKITLLELAAKKYTLEELEQRLGNKFDLM